MDRKGVFILILAVVGITSWQIYYTKENEKHAAELARLAEAQKAKAAAEAAAQPEATAAPQATPASPIEATPVVPPTPAAEPKLETLSTSLAEYTFTNLGGGVHRAKLLDHIVDGDQKIVLNEFGSIPIGAVSETPGEAINVPFEVTTDPANGVVQFQRTDARQLELTKKFLLPKFDEMKGGERLREEYLMWMDLTFTNRGPQALKIPDHYVHAGSTSTIHQHDQSMYVGFNYFRGSNNKFVNLDWFGAGGMLFWKRGERPVYPAEPEQMSDVRWAGVTNQYFTTLVSPFVDPMAPKEVQQENRGTYVWAKRSAIDRDAWKAGGRPADDVQRYFVDGAICVRGYTLEPGQSVTRKFQIFAGPREYRRLRELPNYEAEIMDFGMFGLISKFLLNSMNFLKSVTGQYWAAIVILTLLIRGAMWPLQNKATQTAKRMQVLSPKLKELQEKYKDDPMRMQQETGKLWKQYGINPLSGCLPVLIQIPIFFGFYNMLAKAVELRNAEFLWVSDLSQPDTIAHLLGIPINPLPLLMAATMFWSMALTPKAGDPVQQRILMFMPLIFIFFCYNFASALALYWTVQNIFSVVQLYLTRNQPLPTLQPVAEVDKKKKKRR